MEKATLIPKELQEYIHIGRVKAYELCKSDGFPSFRIGRKVLISREGLDRWLREQETKRHEDQ